MGVCFDWTLRLIGPLLLLFATGLISCVVGMYFKFLLPATAAFGSIPVRIHWIFVFRTRYVYRRCDRGDVVVLMLYAGCFG